MKTIYKYYRNKRIIPEAHFPRDKHATISVITHKRKDLASIDEYLKDCEQQFKVEYIKKTTTTEQACNDVMMSTNAQLNNRGKNIALECLQFGGNREFWSGFNSEQDIRKYFDACYNYAIHKIGFLHTHENIICAVIVTEPNRRNLFVFYLPITEVWQAKVMSSNKSGRGNKLQQRDEYGTPIYRQQVEIDNPRLSHSEFWKARGGLTSYSDLQEDFFEKISKQYGAVRGESLSLVKNTTEKQRERFCRTDGDSLDSLYFDDMPF